MGNIDPEPFGLFLHGLAKLLPAGRVIEQRQIHHALNLIEPFVLVWNAGIQGLKKVVLFSAEQVFEFLHLSRRRNHFSKTLQVLAKRAFGSCFPLEACKN